jgi:diguanylate cyclase (GGDEF)-like protein
LPILTLCIAFIAIILITLITFAQIKELSEANSWVEHTHEVIDDIQFIYQNILEAEATDRAFIITRDPEFINKDKEHLNNINLYLDKIENLTVDNPIQQQRIKNYKVLVKERFNFLSLLYQEISKTTTNDIEIKNIVEKGSYLSSNIKKETNNIIFTEESLLKRRNEILLNHAQKVERFTILWGILTSAFLIGGAIFLNKQLKLRAEAEEQLKHLAYHDMLTGLVNRAYLEQRIEDSIKISQRQKEKMALVYMDLNNFKDINDTMGHDVGDYVLQILSSRLVRKIRGNDTVGRLGGDEFVIIITGIQNNDDIKIILDKITNILEEKISFMGHDFILSASIGVSIYPDDGSSAIELMKKADIAMYSEKNNKNPKNGNTIK